MEDSPPKLKKRTTRKQTKRAEKKRQIAQSALVALRELGYANTSLRDIAGKSDLSLGMLHYYFEDRTDLIIFCVQTYKQTFSERLFDAIEDVGSTTELIEKLADAIAASIVDDARTHRLWYDIRNQAQFDPAFQPVVANIEAMLIDVVAQAVRRAGQTPELPQELWYPTLDGVFQFHMQRQLQGAGLSRAEIRASFATLMRHLFASRAC